MKFKAGMFIGRMQHIHKMHEYIIRQGLAKCEKFIIFVGSAQIGRYDSTEFTSRNPFPARLRIELIEIIFAKEIESGQLIVAPLDDLTNEYDITYEWGKYLLDNAYAILGRKIDYMVYGNDESRKGWFDSKDIESVHMDIVDRVEDTTSATRLRNLIEDANFEEWSLHVNERLIDKQIFLALAYGVMMAKLNKGQVNE